jgi:protease PrsW
MLAFASLIAATLPMILFLWIVWFMDKYDREPVGLLILNFVWGALGAIFLGVVFSILTSFILGSTDFLDAVLVAPVVEEFSKGIFIFWTARDRRFDNVTDGIVYGMAIGLGFGMTENFMYFLGASSAGEWILLVLMRTVFSAVMHAMASGIVGASIGMTKFDFKRMRIPIRVAGFALAMFLHFLWNFSVSIESLAAASLGMLFILGSLIVILVLFQISLRHEKKLIRNELQDEAREGLLPVEHLPLLCRMRTRRKPEWVIHDIDKKKYVQLATRLAFRKAQSRHCRKREHASYLNEIERIRREIRELLFPQDISEGLAVRPLQSGNAQIH